MNTKTDAHESLVLSIAKEMQRENHTLVINSHNLYEIFVPAARIAVKMMKKAVRDYCKSSEGIDTFLISHGLIPHTKTVDNA